ncbi:MAG: Eco57I restriction-modification methylase domain-containing protein [Leptospiraceae bacterium]|nr:Eco57I restriction-modification methylase domain-containing protein [Leptospiraceae bacterium]
MLENSIQNLLSSHYSLENAKLFLESVFKQKNVSFYQEPVVLQDTDKKIAKRARHLGNIQFTEGYTERNISLFEIELQDGIIIERNRVGVRNLLKQYYKNIDGAIVFYFSKANVEWRFSFVSEINIFQDGKYVPSITQPKRYTYLVGKGEKTRTPTQRMFEIANLSELTLDKIKFAFSVESLTEEFFKEFKLLFGKIDSVLFKQCKNKIFSHDYSLQLLNRILFIYFLQRLSLVQLGNSKEFLKKFYEIYKSSTKKADTFVDDWLLVLFSEAFNNGFSKKTYFPDSVNGALENAPFLNGGLYKLGESDKRFKSEKIKIKDKEIESVFDLLERYNFTIAEDSPFDQEVAVDPEMIGKVYESLVNVSVESDEQGEAGMFYTERTEIDLMCRLSVVNYFINHFGKENKDVFYQLVFCYEETLPSEVICYFNKDNGWNLLDALLESLKILDPSCGSGSFLVGMLEIISNLYRHIEVYIKKSKSGFSRKKQIIGQSLYGVDVMEWAVHIAELRLWLQLILEVHTEPELLKDKSVPLLPHFSFNLRFGDSIVQSVGMQLYSHIKIEDQTQNKLKDKIDSLRQEKLYFFHNDKRGKYKDTKELETQEYNLFKESLVVKKSDIESGLESLETKSKVGTSQSLFGGESDTQEEKRFKELIEKEKARLQNELDILEHSLKTLKTAKEIPFVWDIAFVEIFESSGSGFDILIGNPPYVRQEKIADPKILDKTKKETTKKEYKDKLIQSVYMAFPEYFGYNHHKMKSAYKLNAKSDLYIYFFFHGLSLLNEKGTFCFITSNSWLDVGYGKDLQEFLLTQSDVRFILDNKSKRSFKNADVNTVISLFNAPDHKKNLQPKDHTARFVLFKKSFEEVIHPSIFIQIENALEKDLKHTDFNVFPISQVHLYLKPVIKSPRECKNILINPADLKFKIFMCHEEKKALKGTNTLEYIKWGEKEKFHQRPSCSNRSRWWDLGEKQNVNLAFNYLIDSIARSYYTKDGCLFSDNFHEVIIKNSVSVAGWLNSSIFQLFINVIGRANFGGGLLKIQRYELNAMLCYTPDLLKISVEILNYEPLSIEERHKQGFKIDNIIFDELHLTQGERDAVYEAVVDLVDARLKKADSRKTSSREVEKPNRKKDQGNIGNLFGGMRSSPYSSNPLSQSYQRIF